MKNILCAIGIHNLKLIGEKDQYLGHGYIDYIRIHQCRWCKSFRTKVVYEYHGFEYKDRKIDYQDTVPWGDSIVKEEDILK